ncbi:MAG: hypothetical protein WCH40_04880 [Verrucomicrobiales bacterium]
MHKGVSELCIYLPFTSKDLDLVGTAGLLERLHLQIKGNLKRSEPRSPVLGRIESPRPGGGVLLVEVLHTVKGLNHKELGRTMDLVIGDLKARVLVPHLMLKAKIENAVDIDQEGRNDVKHVRMMILCMRAFITEFCCFVSDEKVSGRALTNVLEETFSIISSPKAEKATNLWGIDFSEVWPREELKASGGEKVARWLEHRLA